MRVVAWLDTVIPYQFCHKIIMDFLEGRCYVPDHVQLEHVKKVDVA